MGDEQLRISASAGGETIVLTLHGNADDGSLVVKDGRGEQLVALNARRVRALLAACAALAETLDAPQ